MQREGSRAVSLRGAVMGRRERGRKEHAFLEAALQHEKLSEVTQAALSHGHLAFLGGSFPESLGPQRHALQGPRRYGHRQIWLSDSRSRESSVILQSQTQHRKKSLLLFILLLSTRHVTLGHFPVPKIRSQSHGQHV